jgi:hypothetical protein
MPGASCRLCFAGSQRSMQLQESLAGACTANAYRGIPPLDL